MIFLTWYLYSPVDNMKKLTEARNGKELSGVVSINQINCPPLPYVKGGIGPYIPAQSPPPSPQRNSGHQPLHKKKLWPPSSPLVGK